MIANRKLFNKRCKWSMGRIWVSHMQTRTLTLRSRTKSDPNPQGQKLGGQRLVKLGSGQVQILRVQNPCPSLIASNHSNERPQALRRVGNNNNFLGSRLCFLCVSSSYYMFPYIYTLISWVISVSKCHVYRALIA